MPFKARVATNLIAHATGRPAARSVPLEQLTARKAMRTRRPDAERPPDDVAAIMASQLRQLTTARTRLSRGARAAGQQAAALGAAVVKLRADIADKDAAAELEEWVALLEGRRAAHVPPTPSVLSVPASALSGRGYSQVGDSASQVGGPGSDSDREGERSAARGPRSRQLRADANGAAGSRAGGRSMARSRAARSGISGTSAVSPSLLARVAAMEAELAAARKQTEALEASLGRLQTPAPLAGGKGGGAAAAVGAARAAKLAAVWPMSAAAATH